MSMNFLMPKLNNIVGGLIFPQQNSLIRPVKWEKIKGQILHWKQPNRFHSEYILQSKDHLWAKLQYTGSRCKR